MKEKQLLIFEINDTLVNINDSYFLSTQKTIEEFLEASIKANILDAFRFKEGFSNFYNIILNILKESQITPDIDTVISKFQDYYIGTNGYSLMQNEEWLLKKDILKQLDEKFHLAIVTARPRLEALYALERFNKLQYFDVLVAKEDVKHPKPHPDGIKKVMEKFQLNKGIYVGYCLDDVKEAQNANIKSIAIVPPHVGNTDNHQALYDIGASLILQNVNELTILL